MYSYYLSYCPVQRRKLNCLQFALSGKKKTSAISPYGRSDEQSEEIHTFFFSPILFPPQAILTTFIIGCDTLFKLKVFLRKEGFSVLVFRQKQTNSLGMRLALIRNLPSETFSTGKLQFFSPKVCLLSGKSN